MTGVPAAKHYLQQAGLSSLKVDLSAADAAYVGAIESSATRAG